MKLYRVKGIAIQEFYMFYQSIEVIVDLIIFPVMSVVVFGFLSKYLSGINVASVGKSVLMGMLLWQYIWIVQYTITLGSMWNIWSRNLSNLFVTPLSVTEYICAHAFSGILKGLLILFLSALMALYIFDFNLLSMGIPYLVLGIFNLTLFSLSLGLGILGFIFRFGTRIQALAWGILPFFQPLTAAFYPVEVLPQWLRFVAFALPPTYVFEAGRQVLQGGSLNIDYFATSFLLNILYIIISIFLFRYLFRKSKESGQFARNEG